MCPALVLALALLRPVLKHLSANDCYSVPARRDCVTRFQVQEVAPEPCNPLLDQPCASLLIVLLCLYQDNLAQCQARVSLAAWLWQPHALVWTASLKPGCGQEVGAGLCRADPPPCSTHLQIPLVVLGLLTLIKPQAVWQALLESVSHHQASHV